MVENHRSSEPLAAAGSFDGFDDYDPDAFRDLFEHDVKERRRRLFDGHD